MSAASSPVELQESKPVWLDLSPQVPTPGISLPALQEPRPFLSDLISQLSLSTGRDTFQRMRQV